MNCENGSDKAGAPSRARHCLQGKKQASRAQSMQQDIDDVRSARIKTKNLAVHHVSDGRERMPIACVRLTECVDKSGKSDAMGDAGIRVNIDVVVVVNEIVEEGSAEIRDSD